MAEKWKCLPLLKNNLSLVFSSTIDDVIPTAPVQGSYLADHSGQSQHMFVQPLNENEYSILPVYVANQFSLECINHHLDTINQFLLSNNEGKECLSTVVKDRQACYVGSCYNHCREKSCPVVREKLSSWASNF